MKRKILLVLAMMVTLIVAFTIAVSAQESVHNEQTVDYDAKVTVYRNTTTGTEVNLFDEDKNALIWYQDIYDNNALKSIRADDTVAGDDGNWVDYRIPGNKSPALAHVYIHIGDKEIAPRYIVVLNIMDDDIDADMDVNTEGVQPFTALVETFNQDNKVGAYTDDHMCLEYAFLRLDTTSIAGKAFYQCVRLRYVNLEDLTQLTSIGTTSAFNYGSVFAGCTLLFKDQELDLTNTSLKSLKYGSLSAAGNFSSVPFSSIKLPKTLQQISQGDFSNCKTLKSIYMENSLTSIPDSAFSSCTALEKIYYAGSLDELNTLISNTSQTGNSAFLNIANNNRISDADYDKLEDKSGSCLVYQYSSCDYNSSVHQKITIMNDCVVSCDECGAIIVNHVETENITVAIVYSSYAVAGAKTTSCNNEGCTHQNVVTEAPAIFVALGYSVKEDGSALMGGYSINTEALADYNKYAETPISYGIIMTNSHPDENGVIIENGVLKSKYGIQLKANDTSYARLTYTITGFETNDFSNLSFIIALYVNDENGISFIQRDTRTSTADVSVDSNSITLNTITHKTVVESTIANVTEQMNNETDALEKERLQAIINALNVFVA